MRIWTTTIAIGHLFVAVAHFISWANGIEIGTANFWAVVGPLGIAMWMIVAEYGHEAR